jgi:hypothetical protein
MRCWVIALLSLAACGGGSAIEDGAPPIIDAAPPPMSDAAPPAGITGLHVSGHQIVNGDGVPITLHGVNRSGTEYACVEGWGIFDGPSNDASIAAITAWHANAVRIPLNEDCWLSLNGVSPMLSGAMYQQAIVDYATALEARSIVPILELHWAAPGTTLASAQTPMPDRDHTPVFWEDVAAHFAGDTSVVFELYNEPYPDDNQDTIAGWDCWRDGGTCPGVPYTAAGMQELVTAVRDTGATNVILLGGLQYSNALSHWLDHMPSDPTGNLGAAWHVYNFNSCSDAACWDATATPVAQTVPLVTTEIGEDDCNGTFIDGLMPWLDGRGVGYLGWTWDAWSGQCLVLITDYTGTPNGAYGQAFHDHLLAL